jgi:hypothetical protein
MYLYFHVSVPGPRFIIRNSTVQWKIVFIDLH